MGRKLGRRLDPIAIIGWMCVLVMLALASPGVRLVQAEEGALASVAPSGPDANAGTSDGVAPEVSARIKRQNAQARAEAAERAGPVANRPIALNGRGYNYGAGNRETPRGR